MAVFLLLLILLVLLFGRRFLLDILEWAFAGWLVSVIALFRMLFFLSHLALLIFSYPVVLSLFGETAAIIAVISVAIWQIYLLFFSKEQSSEFSGHAEEVDQVSAERKKNAELWKGK
mgnify:FL=1